MKTKSRILGVLVAAHFFGLLGIVSAQTAADVQFSAGLEIQSTSDFYQPLGGYGRWVDVPRYGRCWHPAEVATDWRPYAEGHWELTDCGWYWISDEPWAWACYHYGSWIQDPSYGWIWIPGTEWAPSWVVWRESPDYDYIGWAPCGPGLATPLASLFVFVDVHHFSEPIHSGSFVHNSTIVSRTRVINNFQRETRDFGGRRERVVINRGPAVDSIERSTGRTFQPKPVTQVAQQEPAPQTIRRQSNTGINRPALHQQPSAQGGNQNERAPTPNAIPDNGRKTLEPTGREQQPALRNQPPDRPLPAERPVEPTPPRQAIPGATPKPSEPPTATPPQNRSTLEPTGREQPRVHRQDSEAGPQSQVPREQTTPQGEEARPPLPANVREKPLEPTGKEQQPAVRNQPPDRPLPAEHPVEPTPPREANPGVTPKPSAPPTAIPPQNRSTLEKPLEPTGRNGPPQKYEAPPPQRVEPKPNPAQPPKREEPRN